MIIGRVSNLNGQYIWIEDLIWCPSQCYYYFQNTDGQRYCIYLRWRYRDPWSASLVKCLNTWELDYDDDWETLEVSFHTDEDYRNLEKEVLDIISARFPHLRFPNQVRPSREP